MLRSSERSVRKDDFSVWLDVATERQGEIIEEPAPLERWMWKRCRAVYGNGTPSGATQNFVTVVWPADPWCTSTCSTSSIGYEDRRLFNIDGKEYGVAAGLIPMNAAYFKHQHH